MGNVEAICISQNKGERKSPAAVARFVADFGIEGDAHGGAWHRQVSLLDAEDIDRVRRDTLPDLKPEAFAENVIVFELAPDQLGLGSRIRLEASVVLLVTKIGKSCHTPCQIHFLTGDCIMPKRGLFARVEQGGEIAAGVEAEVVECVACQTLQAVVLTISDRCSRAESTDIAGPAVASLLREKLGAHVFAAEVLPDEKDVICGQLRHFCDGHSIDLVVTVGETGFAPRDVTPEATRSVVEQPAPGLDEATRWISLARSPFAMPSRGASGIRGRTLILNLPGSLRASTENLNVVLPALPHGLASLRAEVSDCGRPVSKGPSHA